MTWAYIGFGAFLALGLTAVRVLAKRDERWLREQAALEEEARRRDRGELCARCGGRIEYIEESAGNGDVLNAWWAHDKHPEDGHDAQPVIRP